MKQPAIFIDKDGTLIPDIPYNVDPSKIELAFGSKEALKSLNQIGYKLIVISNQSGVARGYFPESALQAVQQRLQSLLAPIPLTGFYYCPHYPTGKNTNYALDCNCRKPKPGLLLKAAEDHQIDLANSWMIGDILNDVEAGRCAGCRTILIDNGNETEWRLTANRIPHVQVTHWAEITTIIKHRSYIYSNNH
jgi:D-glycero-D-manno-heptose 1,7-bisphosphate phosphatase